MKKLFLFLMLIGMIGVAGCKKAEKMEEPAMGAETMTEGQTATEETAAEGTQQESSETTETESAQ